MMGLEVFFIGIVLLLGYTHSQSQNCPVHLGWLKFENHCYKFVAFPRRDTAGAKRTCQKDGATLISVNTIQESRFVSNWLLSNDQSRIQWLTSGTTSSQGIRWSGDGSVAANLNAWVIPLDFTRQEGQLVVYAHTGTQYGWNVGDENEMFAFICEISINEVYRIVQEYRDFAYGTEVENPGMAPRGPMFIKQPQDTVVLGHTPNVFIECLANGRPDPSYEWLVRKNQEMVQITPTDRITLSTGKLEISNPVPTDESTYQCKSTNEYGTILSSSVMLSFGTLGDFTNVATASVGGLEFDGAQLECPQITYKPAITYQWFKNNYDFIRPEKQIHSFISSTGKLFFSELNPSDQGVYHCIATLTSFGGFGNYIGASQSLSRTSLGFSLTVTSGGANQFQPKIQNDFIFIFPSTPMKGGSVRLECFAYGTGPLRYRWTRENGKPLPNGHKLESNNRILMLQNVELVDGGKYKCEVTSSKTNLKDERTTDLVIQAKPYFTYELSHQHVDVGSQLTWHCEAAGRPAPEYTWYKNGEVLRSSPGITVSVNSLSIDSVDMRRDSGMYQCAATNRYGSTFSTAQLRVLEFAPTFEKSPMQKTMSAARGGEVTLICNPQAAPRPTYRWLKDGADLNLTPDVYSDVDHYKLLANGNLMIQDVQQGDQARFTCVVENSLGTVDDYTEIIILEGSTLTTFPSDQDVEVNLTATLLCQASHPPSVDMIYSWSFNNYLIDYYLQTEYRLGEGISNGYLYIVNTQFRNEGKYTCTVKTGMDSHSASAYLTVYGPPGEPAGLIVKQFDPRPQLGAAPTEADGNINVNTTRWLVWTDGEDHGSIITHYFIEFHTNFDPRWRVHPDGDNLPKFQVMDEQHQSNRYARLTNLKAGAGVSFRVLARNSYGIGAPSLPTAYTQIAPAKPTQKVQNVRGGGGSVGDLTIIWDPLPQEDHNGPNLKYRVMYRSEEDGLRSETAQWREEIVEHARACRYEPDYVKGLIYMCSYVDQVGALQFFLPYEVTVQPFNDEGEGPISDTAMVMSAEELPLSAPENVQGEWYNATALLITWIPVPNERASARGRLKGYKINYWRRADEVESDARQNIIELKPGQVNLDQGLIIGLVPVLWYQFNVQAYNSAGNGPKSSTYDRQTLNREPSQFPTEVHVYSVDGFGVRVNFRGISTQIREEPLQGYKVQYWKSNENILNAEEADFGKMSTGVIRNLSSSELYELRVFAYSRAGQGARSSPSVFFTVGEGQLVINPETTELVNSSSSLQLSFLILIVSIVIAFVPEH